MANDSKQGFFSSLFGKRQTAEEIEAVRLESRHKLEERIRQVLAESVEVPQLLKLKKEEEAAPILIKQEEPESVVELLPISASVITRKAPVQASILMSAFEVPQSYAASER